MNLPSKAILHQDQVHRYFLNKEERVIVHKFFDEEQEEKDKRKRKKQGKKGKWVSKRSIPAVPSTIYCKCEGQIYVPEELPEIFGNWGICVKCGAEWRGQ
jgi:hypothetical protein